MKRISLLSITMFLAMMSCRRKDGVDPCAGKPSPLAAFSILETLSDTAFASDTIFRDNFVQFRALATYDSVLWKVGTDPRDFKATSFQLHFQNFLGTIDIAFKAHRQPNTACFPNDNGVYTGVKSVTFVEQFDKASLTKSPLIGRYKGSFTDTPADTFTVRMEYFDSSKYNTGITGAKNFYWFSNFPKGFSGTATPNIVYPELANGVAGEMGFKSFQFGNRDQSTTGWCRGWLTKDTLTILSSGNAVPLRKFVGIKL